MTSLLATRQGLLTRASKRLAAILDEHAQLFVMPLESSEPRDAKELNRRIRAAKATLSMEVGKVEDALNKYSSKVDELPVDTPSMEEILKRAEGNIDATQEVLDRAHVALTKLVQLQEELEDHTQAHTTPAEVAEMKLAPIPLPRFNGDIWEWDTFWRSFDHNVHSRNMDDIYKFNYLLETLEGEAKETAKQFQVSGSTYSLVIAHLKEKYGNAQALVDQLVNRLQASRARSDCLADQLALCDQLSSITSQLELKGEHINNTFLQKQLLSKFSTEIQRHVLRQKSRKEAEGTWSTKVLLADAKDYVTSELKINNQVEQKVRNYTERQEKFSTKYRMETRQTTRAPAATCFYCSKPGHPAKSCPEVTTLSERLQIMKTKKLCRNCGGEDHLAMRCPRGACRVCGTTGHHTSICAKLFPMETPRIPQQGKTTKKIPLTSSHQQRDTAARMNTVNSDRGSTAEEMDTVLHVSNRADVLILAGQAQVLNPETKRLEMVHVMLDSGADRSFISNALADRLNLQDVDFKRLTINTFGSPKAMVKKCGVTVLQIWDAQGAPHSFTVTRINTITEPIQRCSLSLEDKRFLCDKDLQLSISATSTDIRPQVLLGCADMFSLLSNGLAPLHVLPSGLQLIPSRLGYLVAGRSHNSTETIKEQAIVNSTKTAVDEDESQSWEDFCTFESTGVDEFVGPKAEERQQTDEAVWKTFEQTIERKRDGYWVRLPWRKDAAQLPDNKGLAVRRLQTLLNRLTAKPELLQKYQNTLQNQLNEGIIEEVDETKVPDGKIVHYLPHRAVITPQKSTTKLRIVFDASAHLKDAPSLNDVLHRGPVLLPKLFDILLRFRIGDVAVTSDVEKAFLQVRLHMQDRDATRFLWVKDTSQPLCQKNLITYRFSRVTFGLICSPFLLAGTIKHHLQHNPRNKEVAREIDKNTYVDNVVMTARSSAEAITLYKESKEVFRDMKMNLREFISNDVDVKRLIPPKDLSNNSTQKILGILWDSSEDTLNLTCAYPSRKKITKRTVSEQVASVFDPLGWLTPITLHGKRFLQQLWKCEYGWDEPLEQRHQKQWKEIIHAVDGFHYKIQRKVSQLSEHVKLVVLSDASNNGMAACAYIASDSESHLVAGKSKLPSIKENPTIPKLELNALTMAVRLAYTLHEAIKERLTIHDVIVLSDSEIALSWIASTSIGQSVGVLVRNRVREIRKIVSAIHTPVQFGYVNTTANPADCATRGVTRKEFEGHIWWKGPPFISQPIESWPKDSRLFLLPRDCQDDRSFPPPKDCQDEVICMLCPETNDAICELLDWKRHSSLPRCQRVVAYLLRFIKRLLNQVNISLKKKVEKSVPELRSVTMLPYVTATELEMALRVLIRNHQRVHLPPKRQTALKQLKLKEDDQGILRCQGRLGNSRLSFDTKYPCIIASKTDFARLIVQHAHLPLHCGTAHTMANVREKFWIMKLRQLVRSVITRCVPCQKMNNLPYRYPEMDDLPAWRVQRTRPFEHTGIDYFGPLSIKRNDEIAKVYGIILTCAVTRLVHLELAYDMSTTHLLLALRRFCARRGVPASITSDNATNFLLGEEILSSAVFPVVNDISFAQSMADKGVVWKTNTPYAPWQGAIYERLIKSIKHSLYKVMQRTVPTQEVLETLLVEIEGTINSRPLTYQEEKWEETPILRPIDFIQRDLAITYPFESIGDEEADDSYQPSEEAAVLKTRRQAEDALRKSHRLTERFWAIWSQQYLTGLRESHKLQIDNKHSTPRKPEVGHVVLIAEAVLPRNSWRLGRVTKINYSQKGIVREVELRTPNGRTIRRPINLLIPLEVGDPYQSPADELDMIPESTNSSEDSTTNDGLEKTGYNLRSTRKNLRSPCSEELPTSSADA